MYVQGVKRQRGGDLSHGKRSEGIQITKSYDSTETLISMYNYTPFTLYTQGPDTRYTVRYKYCTERKPELQIFVRHFDLSTMCWIESNRIDSKRNQMEVRELARHLCISCFYGLLVFWRADPATTPSRSTPNLPSATTADTTEYY